MSEEKYAAITEYLAGRIENLGIEHQHDFNLCAQSFKVQIPIDSLLLKVSDNFIQDHGILEIIHQFDTWNLSALLMQDSDRIVLVGNEGIQFFARG